MRLKGKVALITGAGGGLGGAAAKMFAAEGAQVVVTDVAEAAVKSIAAEIGGKAHVHDVTDEGQWASICDETLAAHGQIDILINAAGIEGDFSNGGGLNTTLKEWRRVMAINLDGTFLGCRTVMPAMLEKGTGSILNISSIVSFMASPMTLPYGASKAAVQQLTTSMALIGATNGAKVRCNSIHPGVIKTRMTEDIIKAIASLNGITDAEAEKKLCEAVPFGERGLPSDIASLALFLASDESRYITGSAFKADGGWVIKSA